MNLEDIDDEKILEVLDQMIADGLVKVIPNPKFPDDPWYKLTPKGVSHAEELWKMAKQGKLDDENL